MDFKEKFSLSLSETKTSVKFANQGLSNKSILEYPLLAKTQIALIAAGIRPSVKHAKQETLLRTIFAWKIAVMEIAMTVAGILKSAKNANRDFP